MPAQCCGKKQGNRMLQRNRELTRIHDEILDNMESIHGALLRMNRSIQGYVRNHKALSKAYHSMWRTGFVVLCAFFCTESKSPMNDEAAPNLGDEMQRRCCRRTSFTGPFCIITR